MNILTLSVYFGLTIITGTLILYYFQILIPAQAYDGFIINIPQVNLRIHNANELLSSISSSPQWSTNFGLPDHLNIIPYNNHNPYVRIGDHHGLGKGTAFAQSILDGTAYFYLIYPSLSTYKLGYIVSALIDLRIYIYEENTTASPRELEICISLMHNNQSIIHTITSLHDAPTCISTYSINNHLYNYEGKVFTILNVMPTMAALQYIHPPGAKLYIDISRVLPTVQGARAGKGDQYNLTFTTTVTPSFTEKLNKKHTPKSNSINKQLSNYVLLLPITS